MTKEEMFIGYKVDLEKLKEFGFMYSEERGYYFNIYYLYGGNFSMYVDVIDDEVYTLVTDVDKNKEIFSFRYPSEEGSFPAKLGKEFYDILYKIRDICFVK